MTRTPVLLFLGGALVACGASTPPAATQADAVSSMNIPEADWERFDVPEGGFSVELPGEHARQVSTTDAARTYEYLVSREPLGFFVSVERFTTIVTPDHEADALDAVAREMSQRAVAPARGCTDGPIESITSQGHSGRMFVATACSGLDHGSLGTVTFIHGSSLVSAVVAGRGVEGGTVSALLARVRDSIVFGEPPSWFMPADTEVSPSNAPGLTFRMPTGPESQLVEREGGSTARFTSEPIVGMAVVASVTTPATLPAGDYCAALEIHGGLELTARTEHPGADAASSYCEVRGRHVGRPEVYEIHQVQVVAGVVFEITWAGPYTPAFVAGGEGQLAEIRTTIHLP